MRRDDAPYLLQVRPTALPTSHPYFPAELSPDNQIERAVAVDIGEVNDRPVAERMQIDWSASYDAQSGIDYYYIYRDGEEIGRSTSLFYSDSGLQADTSYLYSVSAVNGEGLESAKSLPVIISTLMEILLSGDANDDGIVDVSDLGILATNYGAGSGFGWSDGDPSALRLLRKPISS